MTGDVLLRELGTMRLTVKVGLSNSLHRGIEFCITKIAIKHLVFKADFEGFGVNVRLSTACLVISTVLLHVKTISFSKQKSAQKPFLPKSPFYLQKQVYYRI